MQRQFATVPLRRNERTQSIRTTGEPQDFISFPKLSAGTLGLVYPQCTSPQSSSPPRSSPPSSPWPCPAPSEKPSERLPVPASRANLNAVPLVSWVLLIYNALTVRFPCHFLIVFQVQGLGS